MQSKQKWCLSFNIDEVGHCCGIGIFEGVHTHYNENSYDVLVNEYVIYGDTEEEVIKKFTEKAKKEFMRTLIIVPDKGKSWKHILDMYLKAGWKNLGPSRSRMSRYNLHLLEVQRPLRKRNKKDKDALQSV